jgi:hypothetical protein
MLVLAAATNCYKAMADDHKFKATFREQIRQSVHRLKNSLRNEKVPTEGVIKAGKFDFRNISDYILNLTLCLDGLARAQEIGVDVSVIDFHKLHRMRSLAAQQHADPDAILPAYREKILKGYQVEKERDISEEADEN